MIDPAYSKTMQDELHDIFEPLRPLFVDDFKRNNISAFIDVGEWGLAVECIGEYCYEENIPLPKPTIDRLRQLAKKINDIEFDWDQLMESPQ